MTETAKGLFIDLDGTLADSIPVMLQVYHRFLEQHGRQGSDREFWSLCGPTLSSVVSSLRQSHSLSEPLGLLRRRYGQLVEKLHSEAPPKPGAEQLLGAAREANYAIAVVTSASHSLAERWLERQQLVALVDALIAAEMCPRAKPHPEPYLMALQQLACDAGTSLAVEDSPSGARAAVAAGLPTYVLGSPGKHPDSWPSTIEFVAGLTELAGRLHHG